MQHFLIYMVFLGNFNIVSSRNAFIWIIQMLTRIIIKIQQLVCKLEGIVYWAKPQADQKLWQW